MKKTTILALGDFTSRGEPFTKSFQAFLAHRKHLPDRFSSMEVEDYSTLLAGVYPKISTDDIIVMNFFPYNYWNDYIEIYDKDNRIYGDRYFGRDFRIFFDTVHEKLKKYYRDHRIEFVNNIKNITVDRDKKKTKRLLIKNNIPTPKVFHFRNVRQVEKALNSGISLYVKPQFGAMGKGVTFLSKKRWLTNFTLNKNKIISKPSDFGWEFKKIKGNKLFLRELLNRDFLFEKAVKSAKDDTKRFDLRIYVLYGKVPYLYLRSTGKRSILTNWTQGGKIEKRRLIRRIPKEKIELAKQYAIKAARILDFNFTGVDVIFSKDYRDVYVLELQAFPGFEKGFDLFKHLIHNM